MSKKIISLIMITALFSCKIGDDFKSPKTSLPDSWIGVSKQDSKAQIEQEWWKNFNDETLNKFIEIGLKQNLDIKILEARIEQSRASRAAKKADLMPVINGETDAIRQGNRLAFGKAPFDLTKPFNSYEAGFDASWELDIFGRKRNLLKAESALFFASKADKDAAKVSLLAEIAVTYVNIRLYQEQLIIAEKNIKSEENTARIVSELFHAGKTPELDLIRANAQIDNVKSLIFAYQDLLASSEYSMDLLLAENPGKTHSIITENSAIPIGKKEIILTAPINIIANRPDIIAAEKRLSANVAQKNAAKASFFPDISLSAFFGLLNSNLDNLLNSASKSWEVSGKINFPLLNFNRLTSELNIQKAKEKEALLEYQKSVLVALIDVEKALSSYNKKQDSLVFIEKNVAANSRSVLIAKKRYHAGISNFLDTLDAERSLFEAQKQFAQAQAESAINYITLYKSLGGGWKEKNAVTK